MLTGLKVSQVTGELRNERETNLREMKAFLRGHGFRIADDRVPVREKGELRGGLFYDPEHGILDDFPESNRRYFWEIEPER